MENLAIVLLLWPGCAGGILLAQQDFVPVAGPTTEREITLPNWSGSPAFFRVKLVKR